MFTINWHVSVLLADLSSSRSTTRLACACGDVRSMSQNLSSCTRSSLGSSLFLLDVHKRRENLVSIPFCLKSQSTALTSDGVKMQMDAVPLKSAHLIEITSRIQSFFFFLIKLRFGIDIVHQTANLFLIRFMFRMNFTQITSASGSVCQLVSGRKWLPSALHF